MKNKHFIILVFMLFAFYAKQINAQEVYWEQLSFVPTYPLYGVYCINFDTVIAVGANGYIIRTTNCGITWDFIPSNTTDILYRVHFVDQNTGYAIGENGTILKTTDMGQNWTNIGISTNLNFFSMSFINKDTGWVAGGEGDLYYTSGNKGILLKTINGGVSWTIDSTYDKTIASIFFIDNDTGYMCINNFPLSILRKTTNSGNSFYTIRYDSLSGYYTDIQFINAKIGFFANSTAASDCGIYKSIDYGSSWNNVFKMWSIKSLKVIDTCSLYCSWSDMPGDGSIGKNTCTLDSFDGPDQRIFNFSFVNLDSGFAVGSRYPGGFGVIYRGGLISNIDEGEKQNIEIFPNPFKDIIIINLSSDIDLSEINIMVYNSLCQKILNMNSIKDNKIIIDLSEKPNGLYYLIIMNNNKIIQTKKIIKI